MLKQGSSTRVTVYCHNNKNLTFLKTVDKDFDMLLVILKIHFLQQSYYNGRDYSVQGSSLFEPYLLPSAVWTYNVS